MSQTMKTLNGYEIVDNYARTQITAEKAALKQEIATERKRIDALASLPEGSTAGDAELVDAHIDYTGKNWESTGAHIRGVTSELSQQIDGLMEESVNLFNKDSNLILNDSYVAYEGYRSLSGYVVTHPIKVKKGITYKYPHDRILGNNHNVAICDVNGNFISSKLGTIDENNFIHFTVDDDCYIRVNVGNKGTSNFMVCIEENYPTVYVPYSKKLNEAFGLNDKQKEEALSIKDTPLQGKIISFNGDSICYGAGSSGGYGKIIAENNNMIYENIAVSGATIKAETYSGNIPKHWICRTVNNMREDADYIIFEGGVNDGKGNLGTLSEGYEAELDDTTFYGAFESMLKQALERFKGKKIGYIFAHKCTNSFSSSGDEYNPYYVAKKCLEKWGVPYLDLNTKCPPLAFIPSLKEMYTHNGDGWHPNDLGYRTFYVPKIEAWLKTL